MPDFDTLELAPLVPTDPDERARWERKWMLERLAADAMETFLQYPARAILWGDVLEKPIPPEDIQKLRERVARASCDLAETMYKEMESRWK